MEVLDQKLEKLILDLDQNLEYKYINYIFIIQGFILIMSISLYYLIKENRRSKKLNHYLDKFGKKSF
jgi:hypothetical protein